MNSNWSYSPEILNSGQRRPLFCPLLPWNLSNDPEKQIGYLLYATSSFIHNFKAFCEFKLELQAGNPQFRSKSAISCPPVTLKFADDPEKNNRAPLLCYFKLCALFRNCWWIQTGVTVRKRPIWMKIGIFWSRLTLKFDGWPSKTTGHLFYTSRFVLHFVAIGEFKLELWSGNG